MQNYPACKELSPSAFTFKIRMTNSCYLSVILLKLLPLHCNSSQCTVNYSFLLVSSADNLWKQIGPRSGPAKMSGLIWIQSLLHSDVIPERNFGKVDLEKYQQRTKKHEKFPRGQRVKVTVDR